MELGLTWYWGFRVPHLMRLSVGIIIGAVGWSVGFDALNEAGILKIFIPYFISNCSHDWWLL